MFDYAMKKIIRVNWFYTFFLSKKSEGKVINVWINYCKIELTSIILDSKTIDPIFKNIIKHIKINSTHVWNQLNPPSETNDNLLKILSLNPGQKSGSLQFFQVNV